MGMDLPITRTKRQATQLARLEIPSFESKLLAHDQFPLKPQGLEVMQINLGKMCNQTCKHCHVDAGPHRKEIMTREIMLDCLTALDKSAIRVVDLTGGAPEMNPDFRWFVGELTRRRINVIVRSNLTIVLANPKFNDLPDFFKQHKVEIISSLPHFSKLRTDAQRGKGVFDKSIKALQMLNDVGYGIEGTGLWLNLVYNPTGALLPPEQTSLEKDFRSRLSQEHSVSFNSLFAITNMPISRFLDYLIASDNLEGYMDELIASFNPSTLEAVMCKSMISVGWDGQLYDCDFNQMLEINTEKINHIRDFDQDVLTKRSIKTAHHCYGCTAGNGSSCGGELA
jgi:radical SAM/Cys-rich protein